MELLLKRIARREKYTIGRLYIDGEYFCDTLEDKDRGLAQADGLAVCKRKKIAGVTAIPTGRYRVVTNVEFICREAFMQNGKRALYGDKDENHLMIAKGD